METIAFIGTGVMGSCIAGRLLAAGYKIQVYEIVKEKAAALIEQGALYCESLAAVTAGAGTVISMLGYPKDVESVYFGEGGVLENAGEGTLLIDMTTSSPSLARRIAQAAHAKGLYALDAPVSGGDVGARAGTLSIMVGGSAESFEKAGPLFSIIGSTVTHCGEAGMGQHTKMANQIAVGCNVTAVAEAYAYAKGLGLDPQTMFTCVRGGAGGSWQMNNMADKMLAGDDRAGFYIRHLIKDMDIALDEAAQAGVELPLLKQVREIYGAIAQKGMENCGTQAVYHYYD